MAASIEFLKTKQQMCSHWSLPVFIVVIGMQVWTCYDYNNYKVEIWALSISFESGTANEKNSELKKLLEYF